MLRPAEALLLGPTESNNTLTHSSCDDDLEKGDFSLAPAKHGFKVEKIAATLLEVGDIVRVQSGSMPPVDATIVSGKDSAFDESSLTGESKLIKKSIGDKIFLGTVNRGEMVDARVDAIGGATL